MTMKSALFLSPSLVPFLYKSSFFQPLPTILDESTTPPFFLRLGSPPLLFLPSSLLLLPPSCEIAVVSYGFLFLRDGRWVHVGVEATKHAVSAQHAGQHTQRASCGYDSCHVHINGPAHYQEYAHRKNSMG